MRIYIRVIYSGDCEISRWAVMTERREGERGRREGGKEGGRKRRGKKPGQRVRPKKARGPLRGWAGRYGSRKGRASLSHLNPTLILHRIGHAKARSKPCT